jgi:replicative DNA helicase/predicted GIY-YIG superfamily endonuclease
MDDRFYIYKFLDEDGNILYIGRTNDISRRILKEHFTALGHLPFNCYKSIEKIQYAELKNESEQVAYEAILINKLKPQYNVQFKDDGCFDVELPEFQWLDFKLPNDHYLEYLKGRKDKTQDIQDFLSNHIENWDENDDTLKTGFIAFDELIPIGSTDLILLAGDTTIGKTAYALNICAFVASKLNKKVLYVNLKEDGEILTEKLIATKSKLPLDKIRRYQLLEHEFQAYYNAVNELSKSNIQFTNLDYENKTIDKIINVIKSSSYDLIIIDDLQSIINDKDIYIKDKTLEIMQKLKSLTTDLKTPLILISGIPSEKMRSRVDHRPCLSDLEYDSMRTFPDIIKLLYRDEVYEVDSEKKNILEVIVAKNLLCINCIVELVFLKESSAIVNIEKKKSL